MKINHKNGEKNITTTTSNDKKKTKQKIEWKSFHVENNNHEKKLRGEKINEVINIAVAG